MAAYPRRETVRQGCAFAANQEFARTAPGGGDGLLHVFVPHATAGAAVIDLGAGNDVGLLAAACLLWAAGQLKVSA